MLDVILKITTIIFQVVSTLLILQQMKKNHDDNE